MSKHYISTRALCPFYKAEGGQIIYCEGIKSGTAIHLTFAKKSDANTHKALHCKRAGGSESCPIALLHTFAGKP